MEENLDDPNVLVGEDLLRKYFSLSGPEALRVYLFNPPSYDVSSKTA